MCTLEKDGFIILKNVFERSDLDSIRQFIDRIVKYAEKATHDPFSKFYLKHRADQGVLYDVFQRHPEFHKFATNKSILDSLKPLLGNDIYLYVNSLLYKPKDKNNEVPWHQDFLSRPHESAKLIAWIAIDNAIERTVVLK